MEMRKHAQIAMLLSLAVVLNIFENMIPILGGQIPGLKIGLANVLIIFTLYTFSFKDAFYLSILRVFIVSMLYSGLFSPAFFFSLSGATLSIIIMVFAKNILKLSIIGVSIAGSIFHSIGQVLVAILILGEINIIYMLPWLIIFAIVAGTVVGILSKYSVNKFKMYCK